MQQMALELELQNKMKQTLVHSQEVEALVAQNADNAELMVGPGVEALPNDMVDNADKVALVACTHMLDNADVDIAQVVVA